MRFAAANIGTGARIRPAAVADVARSRCTVSHAGGCGSGLELPAESRVTSDLPYRRTTSESRLSPCRRWRAGPRARPAPHPARPTSAPTLHQPAAVQDTHVLGGGARDRRD